jgi:hypothetical protein
MKINQSAQVTGRALASGFPLPPWNRFAGQNVTLDFPPGPAANDRLIHGYHTVVTGNHLFGEEL